MGRDLPFILALGPSAAALFVAAAWSLPQADTGTLEPAKTRELRPPQTQEPLTLVGQRNAGEVKTKDVVARPKPPDGSESGDTVAEPLPEWGDPPPDAVETGPCRLILHVAAEDLTTVDAMPVELWRLAAPANDTWLEGDQRQATATARDGKADFEALPEGRYRVFAPGARKGSDDPREFRVVAPTTTTRVTLAAPRSVPVLLQVVNEQGERLVVGSRRTGGSSSAHTDPSPDWLQPRRHRDGCVYEPVKGFGRSCGNGRNAPAQLVTAGWHGFAMGPIQESTRACSTTSSTKFEFPGRNSISVFASGDEVPPEGAYSLLGVCVPLDLLASRVVLPDGRTVLEVGAHVNATSFAVRTSGEASADGWRTIPITVWVRLRGFRTLEFETDLDGPMPRWTLHPEGEPREPEDDCCHDGLLARRGEEALEDAAKAR